MIPPPIFNDYGDEEILGFEDYGDEELLEFKELGEALAPLPFCEEENYLTRRNSTSLPVYNATHMPSSRRPT